MSRFVDVDITDEGGVSRSITSPFPYVQPGWSIDEDMSSRVSKARIMISGFKDFRVGMSNVGDDVHFHPQKGQEIEIRRKDTGEVLLCGFIRQVETRRGGGGRGKFTYQVHAESGASILDTVRINIVAQDATDKEILEAILNKTRMDKYFTYSIDEVVTGIALAFNGISVREACDRILLLHTKTQWYVSNECVFHYHSMGGFIIGESLMGSGNDPLGVIPLAPFNLTSDQSVMPGVLLTGVSDDTREYKLINEVHLIGGDDEYGIPITAVVSDDLSKARVGHTRSATLYEGWITEQALLEERGRQFLTEQNARTTIHVNWEEEGGVRVGDLIRVYSRDYGLRGQKWIVNSINTSTDESENIIKYSAELGEFHPDQDMLARFIDTRRVSTGEIFGSKLLTMRGPEAGGDGIVVPADPELDGHTSFTACWWFFRTTSSSLPFFRKADSGAAFRYQFFCTNQTIGVEVLMSTGANLTVRKTVQFPVQFTNKWYFIVVQWLGGRFASSIKIYLNAVEQTSPFIAEDASVDNPLPDTGGVFHVLKNVTGASTFSGDVALFCLWNKVLSETLIRRLYHTFDIEVLRLFEPTALKIAFLLNEIPVGVTSVGGEEAIDYSPRRVNGVLPAGFVGNAYTIGNAVRDPDYYDLDL